MREYIANILSLSAKLTDDERTSIVTSLSIHLDKPLEITSSELSAMNRDELNIVDQTLQAFMNTKEEFPDILEAYERLKGNDLPSKIEFGRLAEAALRPASEHDLATVALLSERWESESITYGLAANPIESLKKSIGDYFWVAEANSEVVGYLLGSIRESEGLAVIEKGELYLEIDEVYVHSEYRSKRIGHRLVDQLLAASEQNGITRSVVYSASKQREKMVGFYEKHGFQMWYVQMYR